MKKASWRENEFEEWFESQPILPGGEKVLLVSRHQAIRNMVDLIAVDREGGLVIIEVKNETANRKAIGQALEYLSLYDNLSYEELADEFQERNNKNLRDEFKKRYGRNLDAISARRRVYLVAPHHDSYSAVCADYLSKSFRKRKGFQPEFHLVTATQVNGIGFSISQYTCPPLVKGPSVKRGFHLGPLGGRLFYVVKPGSSPIVWSIGKWRFDDGTLTFLLKPSKNLLRPFKWYLLPKEPPVAQVDFTDTGSVWRHEWKPLEATIIGYLSRGDGKSDSPAYVAFAQFKDGRFQTFRRWPKDWFENEWKRTNKKPRSWSEIVTLAQTSLNKTKHAERNFANLKIREKRTSA